MAKNSSRSRRWLIAAAVVFVIYAVVGFFVLPPIIRGQIEDKAGAALKRTVTVERVRMNPLVFSIAVEGLRVADHDGAELASWKRGYVNFDPLTSLFRWEWRVGDVELIEPRQRIAIDAEGRINIADLLEGGAKEPAEPGPEKKPLPRIGLGRLTIQSWALSFTDDSHREPFATVVGPMTFELTGLTTRPDAESPYTLQGSTDTGETFGWTGTVSVEPPGSSGMIEFAGLSLPKHAPLAGDLFRAEVRGGTVSFATRYEIALGETPVMRLTDTTAAIDNLSLGFPGADEPAVEFAKLELVAPATDAVARTAEVERVTLSGLNARVERRADGTIDLLDWLPPAAEEPAAAPAETEPDAGPAPSARVARIQIVDSRVQVTDRSNPRPAVLLLDQIEMTATNAGTDMDQEVGVEAKMRWDEGGTIAVNGTVRPRPLAAAMDVNIAGFELAPLDPFVEPQADVRIRDGVLNVTGHADMAQGPDGPLELAWAGDVSIQNLDTVDGALGTPLVAWKSVEVKGSRATLEPMAFSATELAIVEPLANLSIAKDGTINVMAALGKESPDLTAVKVEPDAAEAPAVEAGTVVAPVERSASEAVAEATNQPLPFEAKLDLVTITGGAVRVRDESVGSGFSTELRDFGGTIKGLSSENMARADVDLSASLDGAAPLRISGSINPLAEDKHSDITVAFSNIDLSIFSAYSGQFIGQKIQKGKLNVDLGYKVSQSVLEGENRIVFDQFYLGEKVESPNAMKLPIGLALALLRDREGKINLDVPVRGNLDDPDFKYGRVVWQAIGNIVLKAATSPFKMLGGLLGGGAQDADLSYVDFASASAEPGEEAAKKLDLLARALFERPALRLEINAPSAPEGDRPGLLEQRLAGLLRAEKAKQLSAVAPASASSSAKGEDAQATPAPVAASAESVTIAPEEREALLRAVFVGLFPEDAARAVDPVAPAGEPGDGSPAPTAAGDGETRAGEDEKPGVVTRLFRGLFGGGDGAKSEASALAAPDEAPVVADAEASIDAPPLSIEEIRGRVAGTIELSDADFEALSAARAQAIREKLLASGQIESERIFLNDPATIPEGASTPTEGARVFFGLE